MRPAKHARRRPELDQRARHPTTQMAWRAAPVFHLAVRMRETARARRCRPRSSMRREFKRCNLSPSRANLFAGQRSRDCGSGFTLVEVLVALAILAVSLGAIVPMFSDIAQRSTRSEAEHVSLALAESKLAEAGTTIPIREGTANGADGKYRWALAIRQVGDVLRENPYGMAAYDVAVTVAWTEGGSERSVSLRTLRLGQRP